MKAKKKVSAYSYGFWLKRYNIPFVESIESTLPLVHEYHIVTDRRFSDGSLEALQDLAARHDKIVVHEETLDLDDPGVDGKTKALARSYCKGDLCLQMDLDEVLYIDSYNAFSKMFAEFPEDVPVLGTGVINWHEGMLKYSAAGWVKERVSWNDSSITHGIPIDLLEGDRGDGYYYAKMEKTDGAGYIDAQGRGLGAAWYQCKWKKFPRDFLNPESIWVGHYSWYFIRRKWQMNHTWDYMWMNLFGIINGLKEYKLNRDGEPVDFWRPRALPQIEDCLEALQNEMKDKAVKPVPDFIKHPQVMKEWIKSIPLYDPGRLWKFKRSIKQGKIKR